MMDEFVSVPLQDGESALPVARVTVSHVAFANVVATDYSIVRLGDSSPYEVVPMKLMDRPNGVVFES